jgi:hypothetical protein
MSGFRSHPCRCVRINAGGRKPRACVRRLRPLRSLRRPLVFVSCRFNHIVIQARIFDYLLRRKPNIRGFVRVRTGALFLTNFGLALFRNRDIELRDALQVSGQFAQVSAVGGRISRMSSNSSWLPPKAAL